MHNPPHPGELLKEYLSDSISVTSAAAHLGISRSTLSRILNGDASISVDMDLLLADALGTTPGFWLKVQVQYDIWQAQQKQRRRITRFPQLANHLNQQQFENS